MSCPFLQSTHATINGTDLDLEIADSPAKIKQGLMFRTDLPENKGMLFVYDKLANHSFWMKNTPLPLDMIFIDQHRKVVGFVEQATPFSTTSRRINNKSCYVIETNGGWVEKNNIKEGQQVIFK